jgi:redox-sensitive bicupin YhaK (pirin superfamily)
MAIQLHLASQQKDLGGGFIVSRLLPSMRRRSIGPFVFFDHFGPATEQPGLNHDVRPHPHIGLATVTYLFEGAMMHRDSLGNAQRIEPGAINWMTAGRGIVHSERKPDDLKNRSYLNHGLQLWVALPRDHEEDEPSFVHTPASTIPELRVGDAQVRVLVGEAFGAQSPVRPAAPTLYLDVQLSDGGALDLPPLAPEMALYPVQGAVTVNGDAVDPGAMAVLEPEAPVRLLAVGATRLAIVGGAPLDGPRYLWWNFVSSRRERIVQASADWEAQRMGSIAGDPEFIPLPPTRFAPPEPMS